MPTPKPSDETRSEWMHRCVPKLIDEGKEQNVAVATCLNMWRRAGKSRGMTMDRKAIFAMDEGEDAESGDLQELRRYYTMLSAFYDETPSAWVRSRVYAEMRIVAEMLNNLGTGKSAAPVAGAHAVYR